MKMKKLALLLLATMYFICASGVYIHAHFCGGELSSVSYFALHDNDSCGCGEEPEDTDCCKDILHFYKVDAHQDANFVKTSKMVSFQLNYVLNSIELFITKSFVAKLDVFNTHAPPPYLFAKASKLIVNSVFRI
jgi:hypothetical protein